MKKIILVLVLIGALLSVFYFQKKEIVPQKNPLFVSIGKTGFELKNQPFFPVILNYIVSSQTDGNDIWPAPSGSYKSDSISGVLSKERSLKQLDADFNLIKELGFNTVRIVGIGEVSVNEKNNKDLTFQSYRGNGKDTTLILATEDTYQKYTAALELLFNTAEKNGLKIIFLLRNRPESPVSEEHMVTLAEKFKENTTIFAYDLFNEPLYFDKYGRKKRHVYYTTKRWNELFKKASPYQLTTIGLEGIREVFAWDPNLIEVDFLSLHPYEYEPEQVRNETYWYGRYIKKPWIIGETAIPADNDSVTYEEQQLFARKTIKQSVHCGAWGYSWWQYKDVEWGRFHPNFMGIVNQTGYTTTANGKTILGTVKPVAKEFLSLNTNATKDSCVCLQNYYDYSQNKAFKLKGVLLDKNNKPIEGGVVLAWNQWWDHSYHTITKPDGSFEITSHYPFYHWKASATEYTFQLGDIDPQTAKKDKDGIPTIDLGTLHVKKHTTFNLYSWGIGEEFSQ
ncbi:MAG: hypothetical protein J0M08_00390 [Bacteroidetes bacterium]|nr:hypothetical protein [Bacteroidota bacterium]